MPGWGATTVADALSVRMNGWTFKVLSLPTFFAPAKKVGRPPGRDPAGWQSTADCKVRGPGQVPAGWQSTADCKVRGCESMRVFRALGCQDFMHAKDAACVRMPEGVHCQSGDRRFGVLRMPGWGATTVADALSVRMNGWTFKVLSLPTFFAPAKKVGRPPGRDPAGWQSTADCKARGPG